MSIGFPSGMSGFFLPETAAESEEGSRGKESPDGQGEYGLAERHRNLQVQSDWCPSITQSAVRHLDPGQFRYFLPFPCFFPWFPGLAPRAQKSRFPAFSAWNAGDPGLIPRLLASSPQSFFFFPL